MDHCAGWFFGVATLILLLACRWLTWENDRLIDENHRLRWLLRRRKTPSPN